MPPHHAERFDPLPGQRAGLWTAFLIDDRTWFPTLVGLQMEEIRLDYARMRLPYRTELDQPGGVVHGGALATLIDTVVVPAVASGYDDRQRMLTVNMLVQYLGAVGALGVLSPMRILPPRWRSAGPSIGATPRLSERQIVRAPA